MENKKKLALKTASIFAAALSAITGGNEILNSEDLTSSNSDLKLIEFKTIPSKVKPVGVFKLNPFNLANSHFVAMHRSHSSHGSHGSHGSHSSHCSRTSFA